MESHARQTVVRWMVSVMFAWGSREMTDEAATQCAKDRKK